MLAAIHFDDQPSFKTYEVDDVSPDGMLALELESVKQAISQMRPQLALSVGLI
jgi:hypothetical protein